MIDFVKIQKEQEQLQKSRIKGMFIKSQTAEGLQEEGVVKESLEGSISNQDDKNKKKKKKLTDAEAVEVIKKSNELGLVSDGELEKAKSGVYADTPENRKLGRVGQKFGEKETGRKVH